MMESISEAEVQRWFERKAYEKEICKYIVNANILATRPNSDRVKMRKSVRVRLEALDRARRVYDSLLEAEFISGNRSISTEGNNQLRPDLILVSDSGNYILVELKTNKVSERQAVQELLAYSSAIKMQLPFLNDFMFIIVSKQWSTLLSYSVRSLIQDQKLVLPLKLLVDDNGEFQLSIQSILFDEEIVTESYDPNFAMSPSTMAVFLQKNARYSNLGSKSYTNDFMIIEQFKKTAISIWRECQRINQSGFLIVWENEIESSGKIISLTTVTVNQFWKYDDANHSETGPTMKFISPGIERVTTSSITNHSRTKYSLHSAQEVDVDDLNDIFLSAEKFQEFAKKHTKSSLSYDLIKRHFLDEQRSLISEKCNISEFDFGDFNNISDLLNAMNDIHNNSFIMMHYFLTFGDVSDFLSENGLFNNYLGCNFKMFNQYITDFISWKMN